MSLTVLAVLSGPALRLVLLCRLSGDPFPSLSGNVVWSLAEACYPLLASLWNTKMLSGRCTSSSTSRSDIVWARRTQTCAGSAEAVVPCSICVWCPGMAHCPLRPGRSELQSTEFLRLGVAARVGGPKGGWHQLRVSAQGVLLLGRLREIGQRRE